MESAHIPPTGNDDALIADLRRVLSATDPVPEHVQLAARLAIEWTTLEAELAELVHDSIADEPVLALRGDAGPRALTFEAPELTIEIETETVSADASDGLRLVGQLIPAQAAQIAVHNGDELRLTHADDRGRFDATGLAPGRLSLRCRLADARLVETSWLTI
jgi:hypothetical protein